jgi:hypothetical protein
VSSSRVRHPAVALRVPRGVGHPAVALRIPYGVRRSIVASRAPAHVGPGWRARAPALRAARDASPNVGSAPWNAGLWRPPMPAGPAPIAEVGGAVDLRRRSRTSAPRPRTDSRRAAARRPERGRPRPPNSTDGEPRRVKPREVDSRRLSSSRVPHPAVALRVARSARRRASRRRVVHSARRPALDRRVARARQRRSGLAGEGARAPGRARRLAQRRFGALEDDSMSIADLRPSTPNRLSTRCGGPPGARAPSPAALDRLRVAPCETAGWRFPSVVVVAGPASRRRVAHSARRPAFDRRVARSARRPAFDRRVARARQRRSGLAGEGARAPGRARRLARRRFGALDCGSMSIADLRPSAPNRLSTRCGGPPGARAPSPAALDRLRAAPCESAGWRFPSVVVVAGPASRRRVAHSARHPALDRRVAHSARRPAFDRRVARARQRRSGLAGEGARAPGRARRLARRRFGALEDGSMSIADLRPSAPNRLSTRCGAPPGARAPSPAELDRRRAAPCETAGS